MKGLIFLIPLLAYVAVGCGGAGASSSDPSGGSVVDSGGSSDDGSSSDSSGSTDSGGSGDTCSDGSGSDSSSISITVNTGSGSSGHSGGSTAPTPSPFQGTYVGAWSLVPNTDSGTADWVVTTSGDITGSLFDSGSRITYSVTGHVKHSGAVTVKATQGTNVTTITGTLVLTLAKHLTGTLSETDTAGSRKASFDLPAKS